MQRIKLGYVGFSGPIALQGRHVLTELNCLDIQIKLQVVKINLQLLEKSLFIILKFGSLVG